MWIRSRRETCRPCRRADSQSPISRGPTRAALGGVATFHGRRGRDGDLRFRGAVRLRLILDQSVSVDP